MASRMFELTTAIWSPNKDIFLVTLKCGIFRTPSQQYKDEEQLLQEQFNNARIPMKLKTLSIYPSQLKQIRNRNIL
jgi:hypothetical protein